MTEVAMPERPVDPEWLALREQADTRSRDRAAEVLLPPLLARWADQHRAGLRVVDLGSGTGANLRWLAPLLPDRAGQRWTLVDHDPRLPTWAPAGTALIGIDVVELGELLPTLGGVDLVTGSALLDLLTDRQLTGVVEAVVRAGCPALFSLSVTGEVGISPADPRDAPLAEAFDAHQRRGARLGPDAGAVASSLFRRHGWSVVEASTPWVLGAGDRQLLEAWLLGRAEPAVEQDHGLAVDAGGWLADRRGQLGSGRLDVVVGHVDLLALPPDDPAD